VQLCRTTSTQMAPDPWKTCQPEIYRFSGFFWLVQFSDIYYVMPTLYITIFCDPTWDGEASSDFWSMQESLIVREMSTKFRYREQGAWYYYWFDALKILINDWVLKSLSTTWKISSPEPDGAIAGAQIDRALPKMSDVRFSPSAQLANLLDDSMSLEEVQKAVGKWLVDGFSRFWIVV
jgi:hypothetical protein